MFRQAKGAARIHRDHFIYTVTENEAAIQYRDARFFDGHELAVQIYRHVAPYWKSRRMLSHPRENTFDNGIASSATSGNSAYGLPSSDSFSTPSFCPAL